MNQIARALTIAGSDSSGGAGIQADLKTFQELHVFGMSAITAITAQNTLGVQDVLELNPDIVAKQIDSIVTDLGVDAVKTGMLASPEIIETVAAKINEHHLAPFVVDPVMVSTSGHLLLTGDARTSFKKWLLPLATVITPNLHEAEYLADMKITNWEERKQAAQILIDEGAQAVIIKGGHDVGEKAVDLFYDGSNFQSFSAPKTDTKNTHGTGCTFSAAIAAQLAKGDSLPDAIAKAKAFVTAAISHPLSLGKGNGPTNHWAYRQEEKK
ncbi:bifunctional hydroxymethylpyrimidine kinase/phosphomethylpyrimidine kinase [Thermoactinomyces mirandus]|uniref:Hydroxymethylpyrimidine/phosphomethylpyrimidine kinase n=1 Tax=Thermoactinomyces mirandus TaxID=2756294 RepID=A0A7W1XQY7_9BACL|nr:bifunctional hydroxymethylpyrimidine kinase/phosphomethylpyrimidine kinase [Thermoactinomyces mirandus]MBA4601663.1 bifunctional hydroxymethylpyrimidine kinase/phosphomethylpyrimidine kinase [Thermoactinomyces mirandus]